MAQQRSLFGALSGILHRTPLACAVVSAPASRLLHLPGLHRARGSHRHAWRRRAVSDAMGNTESRKSAEWYPPGSVRTPKSGGSGAWMRDKALPLLLVAVELGMSIYIGRLLLRQLRPSSEDAEAASVVQQRLAARLEAAGVGKVKFNSYEKLAMGVRAAPGADKGGYGAGSAPVAGAGGVCDMGVARLPRASHSCLCARTTSTWTSEQSVA